MAKPLTKEQATLITACTGVMMFQDGKIFKEEVEKRLDRSVSLEEWATDAFREQIIQLFWNDFVSLMYRERPLIITLGDS